MSLFKKLKEKPDNFERNGVWRELRKGLYAGFDFERDRYLLKKHGVIHHLTEEDCKVIVKDLTEIKE